MAGQVLGYLRNRGGRDPEDLLGEVFAQVARNIAAFEGDEQGFRSWVFTIARHRLIDERRYHSRRPVEPLDDLTTHREPGEVEEEVLGSLAVEGIRTLILKLTSNQRDVLLLRLIGGLSVEEVARAVGKRPGAVRTLQHRGLVTLRRLLRTEGVTPGRDER
ncbi:MAG: RNA polymerase sigma factor [Acidimicrobiia bacterium]